MTKTFIINSFILFLACSNVLAQNEVTKFNVYVTISADEYISSEIDSYLKRELRSLNDVDIGYEFQEFELQIMFLEITSVSGTKTGYVFSVVAYRKFQGDFIANMIEDETLKDLTSSLLSTLTYKSNFHYVMVCDLQSLKSACEDIVAQFDSNVLEVVRKNNKLMNSSWEPN